MTNPSPLRCQTPLVAQDYREVFQAIQQNRYFTNHGPLAQEFERQLQDYLKVEQVVTVGNEELAVLIALTGLELCGNVVVPSFSTQPLSRLCSWLNLSVQTSDVDLVTHQPSIQNLMEVVDDHTQAVCLVETWGSRIDQSVIDWIISRKKRVIIIALDSFGSLQGKRYCQEDANVVTVFGFGPGSILSSMQGGAIATGDSELAERYRNIRSSYGARRKVDVVATCNGRFSEFQAGVGLKALEHIDRALTRAHAVASEHRTWMASDDRIHAFSFPFTDCPNHQCVPFSLDRSVAISALDLKKKLSDEGIHIRVIAPSKQAMPNAQLLERQVLWFSTILDQSEVFWTDRAKAILASL